MPNCPTNCGSVTIPFPFGTTEDCSLDSTFLITCNQTTSPHTPFLPQTHLTVLNISLNGELHIGWRVARDCYDDRGKSVSKTFYGLKLNQAMHFHFSPMGLALEQVVVRLQYPMDYRVSTLFLGACSTTRACMTLIHVVMLFWWKMEREECVSCGVELGGGEPNMRRSSEGAFELCV
ncbi:Wall-associated receptor kinase, galacturonan-binding domain [Sesbania bispinosa]|nr:Wall-associated receptor kinase, galacturonan-binding domain [Sesbania bispinosa]